MTSAATLILPMLLLPCGSPRPLSRIVPEFHARGVSVLEALFSLGRENEICFGVEDFEKQSFRRKVDLDVRNEPASDVIKRILEDAAYQAAEQDGVVLVQSVRPSKETWLDYRFPVFKTCRAPLQEVNNVLRMSLIWRTRPGLTGIAGNYSSGTATTQAGPFDEKSNTLRQLLNLIAINTQSGGIWIVHGSAVRNGPAPMEPFWTVVDYGEPFELSSTLVKAMLSEAWSGGVPIPQP